MPMYRVKPVQFELDKDGQKILDPETGKFKMTEALAWNPLTRYPRNAPCPCKSEKKFKQCHGGPNMLRVVPKAEAEKLDRALKEMGL